MTERSDFRPRVEGGPEHTIRLYGISKSRAGRSLWALEEIGLAYEQVPIDYRAGGSRTPEYLAVNPNGRIPTLVDGDLVLYESMAINHYLADRYDGGIRPANPEDRARALMWSFWSTNETENLLRPLIRNRLAVHPSDRDPQAADHAQALLETPLSILNEHLTRAHYLVGGRFSVADINVAFGLIWLPLVDVALEGWPALERWIEDCSDRAAYRRVVGGAPSFGEEDVRAPGDRDPRGGIFG
jgi:glutathione S-transferase